MSFLNDDAPPIYCRVRAEYLYDLQSHHGEYEDVVVFGVSSIHGRAIGFHVITQQGAQLARVPISALVHKEHDPHLPLHYLELWDCFSYQVAVHQFNYLNLMRCKAILRDKQIIEGSYLYTIDWYGNHDAENPGDGGFKNAHVIALDCGCYCALPNNRIIWHLPGFLSNPVRPELGERPEYLTNSQIFKCEIDEKWTVEDSYKMFYEDKSLEPGEKLSPEKRAELAKLRVLKDTNWLTPDKEK